MYISRVDSPTLPCTRMLSNSSIMASQVVVPAHCTGAWYDLPVYYGLSSVVPWFAGTTSTSLVRSGTFTWSPNRSVHLSASAPERRQRRQWTAPSTNSLSEVRRVIDCTAHSSRGGLWLNVLIMYTVCHVSLSLSGHRLKILWGKSQAALPTPGKKGGRELAPVPGLPEGNCTLHAVCCSQEVAEYHVVTRFTPLCLTRMRSIEFPCSYCTNSGQQ